MLEESATPQKKQLSEKIQGSRRILTSWLRVASAFQSSWHFKETQAGNDRCAWWCGFCWKSTQHSNQQNYSKAKKSLYWHQKIHKLMNIYYILSVEIKFKWGHESFFMIPDSFFFFFDYLTNYTFQSSVLSAINRKISLLG